MEETIEGMIDPEKQDESLEAQAAQYQRERDALLGIFSDYEDPCPNVETARKIWDDLIRERNKMLDTLLSIYQGSSLFEKRCGSFIRAEKILRKHGKLKENI